VVLERFAGEVAERLQSASLGASRIAGASLDVAVVAQALNQQRQVLRERLADVAREVREAQVSQVAKQAALDDYDRAFTGIATVFQGLFALVGKDELAARVRPSQRRPGQTEDAGEEAEQPS
jgi:hypothetical protein